MSQQNYARLIGLGYTLIAVLGPFSIFYVPGEIIDSDTSITVQNLIEKDGLFRMGVLADVLTFLLELGLSAMLFVLFQQVNKTFAIMAMLARYAMSIIMGINLLFYLAPSYLVRQEGMPIEQVHALVDLSFQLHEDGIYLWGIFFGVHLLCLSYLIYKCGFLPKVFAYALFIGSFGYVLESLNAFVFNGNEYLGYMNMGLLGIVSLGEISLALYFLIKGTKQTNA